MIKTIEASRMAEVLGNYDRSAALILDRSAVYSVLRAIEGGELDRRNLYDLAHISAVIRDALALD